MSAALKNALPKLPYFAESPASSNPKLNPLEVDWSPKDPGKPVQVSFSGAFYFSASYRVLPVSGAPRDAAAREAAFVHFNGHCVPDGHSIVEQGPTGPASCLSSSVQPGAIDVSSSGDPYQGSAVVQMSVDCADIVANAYIAIGAEPKHGSRNDPDVLKALRTAVKNYVVQIAQTVNDAVTVGCAPPAVIPATAPGTDAAVTMASNCFTAGDVQVTDQEVATLVSQVAQGRSPDDVRADLDALNRSRGGTGTPVCPLAGVSATNLGSPSGPPPPDTIKKATDRLAAVEADLQFRRDSNSACVMQQLNPATDECYKWLFDYNGVLGTREALRGYLEGLQFVGIDEAKQSKIADLNVEISNLRDSITAGKAANPTCAQAWNTSAMVTTDGCSQQWSDWSASLFLILSREATIDALKGYTTSSYLAD